MASEREPQETMNGGSHGEPRRKKQKRKHSKEEPNSEAPSAKETFEKQLRRLEKLSNEVLRGRGCIEDYYATGGREVVEAVKVLANAIAGSKNPTNALRKQCLASPSKASAPNDQPTPSAQGYPPLPPIKDKILETAVFTHQGVVRHQDIDSPEEVSYERLEVLGDAYVEVIATRLIWDRFPMLPAGRISQTRELLVKNEMLAEFSVLYGLDKRLKVPPSLVGVPKQWMKVKGDVFEAYVAAVILSDPVNGLEVAEKWLTELWTPQLFKVGDFLPKLDAKEQLAKKVLGKGVRLDYRDEKNSIQLAGGLRTFYIGVYLTGWGWTNQYLGSGAGASKAEAGDEAARRALSNKPLIDKIAAEKRVFYEKRPRTRPTTDATDQEINTTK